MVFAGDTFGVSKGKGDGFEGSWLVLKGWRKGRFFYLFFFKREAGEKERRKKKKKKKVQSQE